MNIVEEAKKLFDMGKPVAEKALADFLKRHVESFLFQEEFDIRKGLGVDEELGSREYRKVLMDAYDNHVQADT